MGHLQLQYQYFMPALIAWAARAEYTTARPIATQFPGHGCMDDLTIERGVDLPAARAYIVSLGVCSTRH